MNEIDVDPSAANHCYVISGPDDEIAAAVVFRVTSACQGSSINLAFHISSRFKDGYRVFRLY